MTRLPLLRIALLLTLLALFLPSAAAAQLSPAGSQYGGAGASLAQTESASELPFTGMDLALVAAVGLSLLGAGLVLRRAAR